MKGPFKMKGWSPFTKTTTVGEFASKHSVVGKDDFGIDPASIVAQSLTSGSGVTDNFERRVQTTMSKLFNSPASYRTPVKNYKKGYYGIK